MKRLLSPFPVLAALCALLLASCGMSRDEVERTVKYEFQKSLDTHEDYSGYGMKVRTVSLIKSGSNTYNGYVSVDLDGETHEIGITVTVDGGALMHETKPLAFSFLIEKELEKGLENLEKEIENFNFDFDFDF